MMNQMSNQMSQISSDAFSMNVMFVMYEICLPFLNLNDPKETWKKIDPTYVPSLYRLDFSN